MVDYGWMITNDLWAKASGEKSMVGTCGPSSISADVKYSLQHGKGIKFRLLDDDAQVMAEGLQITGDGGEDADFAPLDNLGEATWGCTYMQQHIDNAWVTL